MRSTNIVVQRSWSERAGKGQLLKTCSASRFKALSSTTLIAMARPLQEGSLTGLMLEIGEVTWLIGDRISHKSRHQYGSDNAGETWEQHEVYEAIQVAKKANLNSLHEEVELNGIPAIIKMKKQWVFPYWRFPIV